MRSLLFTLSLALAFTACKSDKAAEDQAAAQETTTETVEQTPGPGIPANKGDGSVTIHPMEPSQSFEDAAINAMSFQDGTFRFTLAEGDYKLGDQTADAEQKMCANSVKGQHIHLIVDKEPYAAKYTPTFEYQIPDGEHYLLAFLSRSYHESIKNSPASTLIKAEIKDNSIVNQEGVGEQMVFYSRPKGTYTGKDTENIMLDFYTANLRLGLKHLIQVDVAGHTFVLDKWTPYVLNGLPMGENTLTLTLIDKEGRVLDSPNNPVSRTFTLAEDKAVQ